MDYDALSRLKTLTDPLGQATQYGYDKLDRLAQSLDAENGHSAQNFDPGGNRDY